MTKERGLILDSYQPLLHCEQYLRDHTIDWIVRIRRPIECMDAHRKPQSDKWLIRGAERMLLCLLHAPTRLGP